MDELEKLHAEYVSYLPLKAEDEKRLWTKLRLDWNYNSNRIEGNTLTYGETEALLILGTEPRRLAKDIREMKAHDLAISHVLDLAKDERPLTQADVRNLNKIALKEPYFVETQTADGNVARKEIIPGEYKTLQNHVTLRGGGLHKFAEPHEVPARMEDTISLIRDFIGSPNAPLPVFLAKLHQDFIQTHPFDDGNGRVVRMLLNYVLIKLGWLPICIKDPKKKDYLAALERADNGDISDLEKIMESEIEWSLRKAIAAAKGESVDDAGDLSKRIDMFVQSNAPTTIAVERSEERIKYVYLNLIIPIMESLETDIGKFETLFSDYNCSLAGQSLKNTAVNSPSKLMTKASVGYTLKDMIESPANFSLNINLYIDFSRVAYKVSADVNDDFSRRMTFEFPVNTYELKIRENEVSDFVSEIVSYVFESVKRKRLK